MQRPIPVIRTASLAPLFLWMQRNQRPLDAALEKVELSFLRPDDPLQVIPLHSMARLLRNEAREAGPDLPMRIVKETSAITGAMVGPFIAAAHSPRNAIARIASALPYLSSHEHILVEPGEAPTIRHFWGATFDGETLHYLHQFVAGMVEMLYAQLPAGTNRKLLTELLPHPDAGLDHLRPHLRSQLVPGGKILTIHTSNGSLDTAFRNSSGTGANPLALAGLKPLRATEGVSDTVRLLIRAMLEVAPPTSADLARAAGLSHRTFQRRLTREGTSFKRLLDEVRREIAIEWLELDPGKLADLSHSLGYSHPTALSRAMRRWVEKSPKETRKRVAKDCG